MSDDVEACPSDVVRAPIERVWTLITDPAQLGWVDAQLLAVPDHALRVGDRLDFKASLGLRLSWTVLAMEPPRQLVLDIALPFGMRNHQTMVLTPLDGESCRVTFG